MQGEENTKECGIKIYTYIYPTLFSLVPRKRETLSPAAPWDRPCTERLSTEGPSLRQKNYGKSGV